MIKNISIQGFRSIRQMTFPLSRLNIISGPNGCGKSNLYKAVCLLHDAANGRYKNPYDDALHELCARGCYWEKLNLISFDLEEWKFLNK